MDKLSKYHDFSMMNILHFAPEAFFRKRFQDTFKSYTSSDISMANVDIKADIRKLPFRESEFDLIYASHVLEHVKEDSIALSEIHRVLRPNGIAIVPVPIVVTNTIEYPEPNPFETFHVRAPGFDYFERYLNFFTKLDIYSSQDFPSKYQTYIYEDRRKVPSPLMPLREPMRGKKHIDMVPVCYK